MSEEVAPWWAIAMIPLDRDSHEWKVRKAMQDGRSKRVETSDRAMSIWTELLARGYQMAEKKSIDKVRAEAFNQKGDLNGEGCGPIAQAVRDACLWSPRAFCQFANIMGDEGEVINLADFHLDMINAMRKHENAAVIVCLEHGKTYISSILVPLMDWAEWPNATECRVFWNETHVKKQVLRLMQQVEYNRELQMIFPWIRKPVQGQDRSVQWSMEGFSIGGRTLADRSYEPLTARSFTVGNRYSVVAADDWVTRGNCTSLQIQDKLDEHFHQAVMSYAAYTKRPSEYGTTWGRVYITGTFYDRRDINYRVYNEFKKLGYKTIKTDVYPLGPSRPDVVLWPEGRPPAYIEKMKQRLGPRAFRLRMRNMVIEEGMQTFTEDDVESATQENYAYGELPVGAHAVIGFDPASGSTSKWSADPALTIYAEVDDADPDPEWGMLPDLRERQKQEPRAFTSHFVKWQRLQGYDFPKQCAEIINWARYYHLPVVIESNTLQRSYKEQINKLAPDVRVYLRHTGRDIVDPDDGIETFGPLFEAKRVVIHAGGAPWEEMRALTTQLLEWPQVRKKDLLCSFWFGRYWMRSRHRRVSHSKITVDTPNYVEDSLWFWENAR